VTATVNDPSTRCKVSVMAEAVAEMSHAVSPEVLAPYPDHWHPIPSQISQNMTRRAQNRKVGQPMVALTLNPRAEQVRRTRR
jgi:transcription factor 1